ncbi:hypothetical protein Ddye_013727 [Dipteronia dyeriana]|uniref:Uncharacterized protein n=1 Tax=Dipteronia dyeriana TaxID=168575 RepID=A0AAD9X712_9ROSI|nr:hypothetical protein Ddye_013727 [Dipteronia dyeriana]
MHTSTTLLTSKFALLLANFVPTPSRFSTPLIFGIAKQLMKYAHVVSFTESVFSKACNLFAEMKLMVELYKQMIAETDQHETFVSAHRPLTGDNLLGKHLLVETEMEKCQERLNQNQRWRNH